MRYLLGFHDQINPGSGPAAAWPALSATFPESGDTTPKPRAQATYLRLRPACLPRHDDARRHLTPSACWPYYSPSRPPPPGTFLGPPNSICQPPATTPWLHERTCAARISVRRPFPPPPIIHHPHASTPPAATRHVLTGRYLQSCRMPNRQRTNQTAT
jgi:hypothetical protein